MTKLEKLQDEFESMEREKNHWWSMALVRGEALRQININASITHEIHEIALKALEYEPPAKDLK